MIPFLTSFLAAVTAVAITLAVVIMLFLVGVVLFSRKLESPTDFFFSVVRRLIFIALAVLLWLWGYVFRMLL